MVIPLFFLSSSSLVLCNESRDQFKQKIIGDYEDRIRRFSNPERIFEFFASVEKETNEFFMTPSDFIRSITPFSGSSNEQVGSSNFKYNWKAKDQVNTTEEVEEYKNYLSKALSEGKEQFDGNQFKQRREDLNIYEKTHIEVVTSLNLNYADVEEFLEGGGAGGAYPLSSFIRLVDVDGDGLISFQEFSLFTTLAGLGPSECSLAFDLFDRYK